MCTFLNIHTHRPAASASESVIYNYILQNVPVIEEPPTDTIFSAGIHPWLLPTDQEAYYACLRRLAALPGCIAIGECGLDKIVNTGLSRQSHVFRKQIEIATMLRLPLVIHCVKAWNTLYAIQKEIPADLPCIIHGFRGNPDLAGQLINKGFYLSFGFNFNPESLQDCPPDRIFLETDENPLPVEYLYRSAAELRRCTAEELNTQCWENLRRIVPASKKITI